MGTAAPHRKSSRGQRASQPSPAKSDRDSLNILTRIRKDEFESIARWLRPGMRVLEIGGGTGYQAHLISQLGCDVLSIDLAGRPRVDQPFHQVVDYDGLHFPAARGSFDAVFSSNVLEHIRELGPILDEIRRVLKPGGVAIHIMPSASWRFWTTLTSFVYVIQRALGRSTASNTSLPTEATSVRPASLYRRALQGLLAHGEYPNALAELFYFRRARWRTVFRQAGFKVVEAMPSGLYYSGYVLAPDRPLQSRRRLARFLGSSTNIFVTRPVSVARLEK